MRLAAYDSGQEGPNVRLRGWLVDRAEGDLINVKLIDADLTVDDNQDFSFVGNAKIGTIGTGELGFFERGGVTILHANTDDDPESSFQISLTGVDLGLIADDFVL